MIDDADSMILRTMYDYYNGLVGGSTVSNISAWE